MPAIFLGEEEDCENWKTGNNSCTEETKVSIYEPTTPDSCLSIAVGIVHRHDSESSSWPAALFVKDRNRYESIVQATNYRIGALLSSALSVSPEHVVVASHSVPRPPLPDLVAGSAAWQLWRRKERVFEEKKGTLARRAKRRAEAKRECDARAGKRGGGGGGDDGNVEAQRPSAHDCWQLEAAAPYLPRGAVREEGDGGRDVDASLRAKLRRAASRSPTGALHLWDVLVLAGCCQGEIRSRKRGWEGCQGSLVPVEDALTREEVLCLLEDKLETPEVEASVLFCAITAQPDAHQYNLAVQEVPVRSEANDGETDNHHPSSWGIALVNFDTGTLPVHAGVHLAPCEYLYDGHEMNTLAGWEFDGDVDCGGYYYPTLVQLLGEGRRLSAQGADGFSNLDRRAVRSLVEKEYDVLDCDERKMSQLGSIVEERISIMQKAIREAPRDDEGNVDIGLRELCFRACGAWERDYAASLLDDVGETVVWMKRWAQIGELEWGR